MHIDIVYVFLEEVGISFGPGNLGEDRKSCIINAVPDNKSVPFSKIPSFFEFIFGYYKLTFVEEMLKRLSE